MDHRESAAPAARSRLVRDFSMDSYFEENPGPQSPMHSDHHAVTTDDRHELVHSPDTARRSDIRSPERNQDARIPDIRSPDARNPAAGFLSPIEEKSAYAPSVADSLPSAHTAVSGSSGRLTDFFGSEVFQIVLHNPTTAHQLTLFSTSRFCGENMEFLEQVDRYHSLLNELTKTMFDMHRSFISTTAPAQLNLSDALMVRINKDLKSTLTTTFPRMESLFAVAQDDIESLVASDIYPRFVRHQMTLSATKALATDRSRYAGLGDCFVLTNPAKADNPIVYASDGFVKVTGYTRTDIIPRNCRFLQGRHTDRQSVKRIKIALDGRHESVELLLNYKKSGEPFWNLLYVTPLYDVTGNVVFFLGGQINCSTTIHGMSDILRILSTPQDVEEDGMGTERTPAAAARNSTFGFMRAFRSGEGKGPRGEQLGGGVGGPGMEGNLLNRIEKLNLRKQMDTFYTAYSKYLIITWSTLYISFYSAGLVDMLYPSKPNSGQIVGVDVFRFLHHHANSVGRDFKSRVKSAIKVGSPVSLELSLCTRRHMGFERFVTHWTPLKDEGGGVSFVVLTLGVVGG